MSVPKVGYLTYMSLGGCSGCETFSNYVLPKLIAAMDKRVNYIEIQLPQGSRMSDIAQGYELLYKNRPYVQFPMLAWSTEHPSISQSFSYYEGDMGKLNTILSWINERLPQQTYGYLPPSQFMVPASSQPYSPGNLPQAGSQVFGMFPKGYY